jgi:hypothetical protein
VTVSVYYDTEMTQFSTVGGGLPPNVQIRESPTKASLGRTMFSSVSGGSGGYQTDSFFDIFTEVSTDGGASWLPSIAGPATMLLRPHVIAPSPVTITSIARSGGNFLIKYAGGSGSHFVLMSSPTLTTPLSAWARDLTNSLTPGSFSAPAVGSARFYRVKSE